MNSRTRILLMCCLSFVASVLLLWYWIFLQRSADPVDLALRLTSRSPAVVDALGGHPLTKRYVTGHIISGADYGNADLTIHIAGPQDRGTLLEWAQNGIGGWHICSMAFIDTAGHETTIVSDSTTNCERE